MSEKTILIVEDNLYLSQALTELIVVLGYKVNSSINATDALLRIQSNPPDLIIADIGLPDISGIQLAQKVRNIQANSSDQHQEIPFVIMTGDTTSFDPQIARDLKILNFLPKPFDFQLLKAIIDEALGNTLPIAC